MLREVADRLRAALRPQDVAARLGGDEFVVLVDDIGQSSHAAAVAERLVSDLSCPYTVDGESMQLGASIGVVAGRSDTTPDSLLQAADEAMYTAKRNGKNRHVVLDGGSNRRSGVRRPAGRARGSRAR